MKYTKGFLFGLFFCANYSFGADIKMPECSQLIGWVSSIVMPAGHVSGHGTASPDETNTSIKQLLEDDSTRRMFGAAYLEWDASDQNKVQKQLWVCFHSPEVRQGDIDAGHKMQMVRSYIRQYVPNRPVLVQKEPGQEGSGQFHDPICNIAIEGVSFSTTDDEMKKVWGAKGLSYQENPGIKWRNEGPTFYFSQNPSATNNVDRGPLRLSRVISPNGHAGLSLNQEDSVNVTLTTGQTMEEAWRKFSFANKVSARVAQLCSQNNPRVTCRFEGSMPVYVEVRRPENVEANTSYCMYGLHFRSGAEVLKNTIPVKEYLLRGNLTESLSRHRLTDSQKAAEDRKLSR